MGGRGQGMLKVDFAFAICRSVGLAAGACGEGVGRVWVH
jgi:hypothetical protein